MTYQSVYVQTGSREAVCLQQVYFKSRRLPALLCVLGNSASSFEEAEILRSSAASLGTLFQTEGVRRIEEKGERALEGLYDECKQLINGRVELAFAHLGILLIIGSRCAYSEAFPKVGNRNRLGYFLEKSFGRCRFTPLEEGLYELTGSCGFLLTTHPANLIHPACCDAMDPDRNLTDLQWEKRLGEILSSENSGHCGIYVVGKM